jgi:hypothetical protein
VLLRASDARLLREQIPGSRGQGAGWSGVGIRWNGVENPRVRVSHCQGMPRLARMTVRLDARLIHAVVATEPGVFGGTVRSDRPPTLSSGPW